MKKFYERIAETGKKRMQPEENYDIVFIVICSFGLWKIEEKMERTEYGENQKKVGGACLHSRCHLDFLGNLHANV